MVNKIHYGEYAFLGGLVLALIMGLLSGFVPNEAMPVLTAFLFLCGIVVGLLNISDKEVTAFLVASVALLVASESFGASLGKTFSLGGTVMSLVPTMILGVTTVFQAFIAPAAFIVAIKAVYKMAKPD